MRRFLLVLLALSIPVLVSPDSTMAQDAITIVRQSEEFTYGQELRFSITASATTVFTEASLTVLIPGRPAISEVVEIPRTSNLDASKTITVSEHEIPPFAEISYQWELTTFGGSALNTEPRSFRYEDNLVEWSWAIQERQNIIVHWDGEDPGVAQLALDVALESLAQTDDLLGTNTTNDIHLYIYPGLEPLSSGLRLHNHSIQDWVAALALPDQSVILLAATAGPQLLTDLKRDLPHELTHIAIHRAARGNAELVPAWFTEGLAIMSSAEPDAALRVTLENATSEGRLLPLESLCREGYAGMEPVDAALAYAQSESLMRHISERYGGEGIQELMTAFGESASCDWGVERALDISFSNLERAWRGELRRSGVSSSGESALPWMAFWGFSILISLLFVVPPPRQPKAETLDTLSPVEPTTPIRTELVGPTETDDSEEPLDAEDPI